MKNFTCIILLALLLPILSCSHANAALATHREKQLENREVVVWKATIEPHQPLAMHRHDRTRMVVALTDVDLTVKNDQEKSHKLIMKKGTARLLAPDKPGELHCDINNLKTPIEVMVIEFKK